MQDEDFSRKTDAAPIDTPIDTSFNATQLQTEENQDGNLDVCSLDVTAYVHELLPDNTEEILNFERNPELTPSNWGFYDKQNTRADVLNFNRESTALYDTITSQRTLSSFADETNLYLLATFAKPTLIYEKELYEIVRHEIKDCTQKESGMWMCSPQNASQGDAKQQPISSLDSIQNVFVDCGMRLHFGWIVRKIPTIDENSSLNNDSQYSEENVNQLQNNKDGDNTVVDRNDGDNTDKRNGGNSANKLVGDLNFDDKVNTLDLLTIIVNYGTAFAQADLNNDGIVNALDYTLVVAGIVQ